ncbi:hypothetical protein NW762_012541 [Fusarium torreyae]|uniref:Uncharacterized protein n=1 Tax=Fusarium torreyae TaxID=1237075 RepID=A0A9W8RRA8_9HYPO|nr:hypothetical protein NW762_012541 [Fusarium torreyae]
MIPTGGSCDAVPEVTGPIPSFSLQWPEVKGPDQIPIPPPLPVIHQVVRPPTPSTLFSEKADLRLDMATITARMLRVEYCYAHLPNSPID